jgi:hypothetical protein
MTALFKVPKPPKFPTLEAAKPAEVAVDELNRVTPKPETGAAGSVAPTPVEAEDEAASTLRPRRKLVGVR